MSAHILLVEDEEHLAVGIKFNLEAEGYQVTHAKNGSTALRIVEDETCPVDLIVLDLMLPGLSGYEVCQQVRDSGKHMPVLMLSARTLSEDRTKGFDVGANQYMVKPFELDELISRIKNLLSQSGSRPLAVSNVNERVEYEFGNAKINFETYEVQVGEKTVRLTQLQMKTLKYFIEHEGRVIPRQRLLEEVWELPGHMNTRAPDQVLRQLRKTFESDSGNPRYFLTIRDAGYRFVSNPGEE